METVGRRKSVTCGDGDGDGDSDGDGGGEGVGDPALGNVGYRFRKHFPGHGYFDGIVIQIRPEAGALCCVVMSCVVLCCVVLCCVVL